MEPARWRNRSPGDFDLELDEVVRTDVGPAVGRASKAFADWSGRPLDDRIELLRRVRDEIDRHKPELARAISVETGKPVRESTGELGAVVAKFDLTFSDAKRYLADESVADGPHPSLLRRRARGPAAVIAPFNFPLHLGHGAAVAHLVAGNPVLFKPSPQAAVVAGKYADIIRPLLPPGVFEIVQGGGETGRELCVHPGVRSICFTGSAAVGKSIAREVLDDLGKDVALELGGKNAAIVLADADLDLAAGACADAACLTAGQRCNATSRIIVDESVADAFLIRLIDSMKRYVPGDPLNEQTLLGPLISPAAVRRYANLADDLAGDWPLPASVVPVLRGKTGCWVRPAIFVPANPLDTAHHLHEAFAPIVWIFRSRGLDDALRLHDLARYGLTTSIFTRSRNTFEMLSQRLNVGNVYANLPTTFSPSTLPFGGLGESGNRHPGGRGFVRFVTDEQAVQIGKDTFDTTA